MRGSIPWGWLRWRRGAITCRLRRMVIVHQGLQVVVMGRERGHLLGMPEGGFGSRGQGLQQGCRWAVVQVLEGPVVVWRGVGGFALVGHRRLVPVLVGHVVDDLEAAVRQLHRVAAPGHFAGSLLHSGEVVATVVILHAIGERVGFGLKPLKKLISFGSYLSEIMRP